MNIIRREQIRSLNIAKFVELYLSKCMYLRKVGAKHFSSRCHLSSVQLEYLSTEINHETHNNDSFGWLTKLTSWHLRERHQLARMRSNVGLYYHRGSRNFSKELFIILSFLEPFFRILDFVWRRNQEIQASY